MARIMDARLPDAFSHHVVSDLTPQTALGSQVNWPCDGGYSYLVCAAWWNPLEGCAAGDSQYSETNLADSV